MRALTILGLGLLASTTVAAAGETPAKGLAAGAAIELCDGQDTLQRFPQAAATPGGAGFLVVWQDGWTGWEGDGKIRAAFVKEGAAGKAFTVCDTKGAQERPAVAAGKDGFLVVWQTMKNGKDSDVFAARVSADGKCLDPEGLAIAAGEGTQCNPTVASDGTDFLVAWQSTKGGETYRVEASRVSADGKLLDKEPLALGEGASPAAAFGGGKYLVAWSGGEGQGVAVQGSLVPPEGAAGKFFPVARVCTLAPSVAAGKKGFVVIASCKPEPNPWGWGGPSGFAAARVSFDGGAPDAGTTYDYNHAGLAARSHPGILDSAQWKRKGGAWPAGQVGGFSGTENDQWPHLYSAVAAKGDGFVAVWVRRKIRNRWMLTDADLYGTRFGTDPLKVDQVGGATVAAGDANESYPALASDGEKVLLVYEAVTDKGVQALARFLTVE